MGYATGMTKDARREINERIGRNVKRIRQEKRWTQEQLAAKTDTDRRYIGHIEAGKGVGSDVLQRLCNALGVTEEDLKKNGEPVPGHPLIEGMARELKQLEECSEPDMLRFHADLKELVAKYAKKS